MWYNASVVKKERNVVTRIRWLFAISATVSALLGVACAMFAKVSWGFCTLTLMVNISAILFGVFGIWLGMFYKPDVADSMNGKRGDDLTNTAKNVLANAKRFEIVFRGMRTSAAVLVYSMLVNIIEPFLQALGGSPFSIKFTLKWFFFSSVIFSVIAQCYSVLMSIVPMAEAKRRMDKAKRDAEDTLAL